MFVTSTIAALEEGIRYSSTKQKAISTNLANVDTPNFKEKTVSFDQVLQAVGEKTGHLQAKRTDERHLSFPLPGNGGISLREKGELYNHNGNSVDVDKQMTEMAKNQLYYNALIDRISGSFQSIETAIKGGK
ncbi:flagellar basal body rod protein FlgB [Shouchella clausii]|uniref:flagellar basal body rod protein FlgB n=1 Tax=Shouchella clausii TaxID=79880 RepID=UPI0031FCBD8D